MNLFVNFAIAAAALMSISPPTPPPSGAETLPPPKIDVKGIARTQTVRSDFVGNREAIQVRVDFASGAAFPRHSHRVVEIGYFLTGVIEYDMNGKTYRVKAGESLAIPVGTMSELATYVVAKHQPIVILAM